MWDSIDLHAKNRSYYIERCIGKHMNDILDLEGYDVREWTLRQIAIKLLDQLSVREEFDGRYITMKEELLKLAREMN